MCEISLFISYVVFLVYINEYKNMQSKIEDQNEIIMRLIREVNEHKRRLDNLETKVR